MMCDNCTTGRICIVRQIANALIADFNDKETNCPMWEFKPPEPTERGGEKPTVTLIDDTGSDDDSNF